MSVRWQDIAAEKKIRQVASIPIDWLITPPPDAVTDVTRVPDEFLSPKEKEITNTIDVDVLLAKLASGELSSVEVTTAFYKRAIIAHQLVNTFTRMVVTSN
jgi:amidase